MNFLSITSSDDMWKKVSQFAQSCSWRAGKSLSQNMSDNTFTDWERVIVALHENNIAGYCTVAKSDCTPNVSYTPYIGYMFVDEKYRGHHLSQKLISYAISYLQTQGFHHVYLVSDHENFYEKYGFKVIDKKWHLGENSKKSICVRYKILTTRSYRYQKGITPHIKSRKVRCLCGFPAFCLLLELISNDRFCGHFQCIYSLFHTPFFRFSTSSKWF